MVITNAIIKADRLEYATGTRSAGYKWHMVGKKAQEYTVENIFDLIHKWAQDIDPDNLDTQKVLSQVATYKKDESNFIDDVIVQKIERAHFFR